MPRKGAEYWVLVFSEDYIRFLTKHLSGKKGASFKFLCAPAVENYITQQLINNQSPSTLLLKSCLYAVLEEYLKNVKLIDKPTRELNTETSILDYVEKNYTHKITLADLATKLGYDYNYMSRYFHNAFNMTFSDFVNIYRLQTATMLLEETHDSIATIALKSGFQSIRSFNSFFKKSTGTSPTQYRKASRK